MNKKKDKENRIKGYSYSKEIEEIIGNPPPWIVRWGMFILIIVLGITAVLFYYINPFNLL